LPVARNVRLSVFIAPMPLLITCRFKDRLPRYQLEVLRVGPVVAVLGHEQPVWVGSSEIAGYEIYPVGFLRRAVCASGNAKATGWFHAGQAKKRVGVIALTRGDKEPAVLAFGPDRQPLDIGDQLLAVGFSDEFAFGCTGRKTPDATRFL